MRLVSIALVAVMLAACGKAKRDAGSTGEQGVSAGDLDAPPDTNALRETPGVLPQPSGATAGVARTPLPPTVFHPDNQTGGYRQPVYTPTPQPQPTYTPTPSYETRPALPSQRVGTARSDAGAKLPDAQRIAIPPESLRAEPTSPASRAPAPDTAARTRPQPGPPKRDTTRRDSIPD